MNVVLLAGGLGTRLSEYTHETPKPMVNIGNYPILIHIMNNYVKHGHKDFYIAMGYKFELIIKYFFGDEFNNEYLSKEIIKIKDYKNKLLNSDVNISLVNTGLDTMTGGRLKRLEKYIDSENFLLTYGDGLSNVNISELVNFHSENNKIATLTAVHPPAQFGELQLKGNEVVLFEEKPEMMKRSWINGGFFIFNKKIFSFINGDHIMLERQPLEELSKARELLAFKHEGFWQCMDNKRDRDYLEKIIKSNKILW
tara:strand:+ start:1043 stop:1804 length:762 start_codon:yes stop_codon:yes gene_type:complete